MLYFSICYCWKGPHRRECVCVCVRERERVVVFCFNISKLCLTNLCNVDLHSTAVSPVMHQHFFKRRRKCKLQVLNQSTNSRLLNQSNQQNPTVCNRKQRKKQTKQKQGWIFFLPKCERKQKPKNKRNISRTAWKGQYPCTHDDVTVMENCGRNRNI